MGKSSYSSKRKRSKYSSPGSTKKRSKTRRARLKKLRRRDDSDSYSTDDSRSSMSVSANSEDSYRSRKSRSHICKDAKGAKRRGSDSSSSTEARHFRKHKYSRRKFDSEVKKKALRHKNKVQRDASFCSRNRGSCSCSICQNAGESSDESEYGRRRGRSERRGNSLRSSKNVISRTKKRRYRSRSCSSCSRHRSRNCSSYGRHRSRSFSSCSRHSVSDYWSQEKVSDGNISKRLRSVITHTKNDEEGRELELGEHKEEIIYESDGYPSGQSNDSNDGENKSALGYQSHNAFENERPIENEKRADACVFNVKTAKLLDSCKDGDDHYEVSKPSCYVPGANEALEEKTNETSKAADNVNAEDWELILRQKALENLRRFRGGMQINASTCNKKDESNDVSQSPSPKKSDLSQNEYAKDDGSQGVAGVHSVEEEKILEGRNGGIVSDSVKNNAFLPNKVPVSSRGKVKATFGHGINKKSLVQSALKQALSNATNPSTGSPASQVSNKVRLVTGSNVGDHNVTSFSGSSNSDEVDIATHSASAKPSSCLASAGRDVGLNKLQDDDKEDVKLEQKTVISSKPLSSEGNDSGSNAGEPSSRIMSTAQDINPIRGQDDGKDGSQLQQKTMSVMRGGEMVQVSYKVYIPKKAPALARRQLKQ